MSDVKHGLFQNVMWMYLEKLPASQTLELQPALNA